MSANDDDVGYGSFPVEFVVTSSLPCEIVLGLQWLAFFRALNIRGVSTPGKFWAPVCQRRLIFLRSYVALSRPV